MKRSIKRIITLLCMVFAVLTLGACSGADKEPVVTEKEQAYLESVADFVLQNYTLLDTEQLESYAGLDKEDAQSVIDDNQLPFLPEAFTSSFSGYLSSADDLGAYISTDSYEDAVLKGDEFTLVTNTTFEKHKMQLSMTFDQKFRVTSVAVNVQYSTAEILEKAALNTVLGMGTVFAVLIFISVIISLFAYIPKLEAKFKKKPAEKTAEPIPAAEPQMAEEVIDDTELVAVITAAVAASMGTSTDGFVVRSIKRSRKRR